MEAVPQACDPMECKCTADIYSMKAMAARPAAPKEATSLAPAPVNGVTGVVVFPAAVVAATGAPVDQTVHDDAVAATGVVAALVTLVVTEVTAAGVLELDQAPQLDAELLEAETETEVVVATVVVLLLTEALLELELLTLTGVLEVVVQAPQLELDELVTFTGTVVVVVVGTVVVVVVGTVVVVVVATVVVELLHAFQADPSTAAAEAAPAKAAAAMKDFILIFWFVWFVLGSWKE